MGSVFVNEKSPAPESEILVRDNFLLEIYMKNIYIKGLEYLYLFSPKGGDFTEC